MPNGKNIAYLGWGSLIWNPGGLPIQGCWRGDGPFAKVEFTRKSSDGRITLVLDKDAAREVPLLWVCSTLTDPKGAKEALRIREGEKVKCEDIHSWGEGGKDATLPLISRLPEWAEEREIDVVIWTGLPPKFDTVRRPSIGEVIGHLCGLEGVDRYKAERYIRYAPPQIRTEYRQAIENDPRLGWTPCP